MPKRNSRSKKRFCRGGDVVKDAGGNILKVDDTVKKIEDLDFEDNFDSLDDYNIKSITPGG